MKILLVIIFILVTQNAFAQAIILTWQYKDNPEGPAAEFMVERRLGPLTASNPWQQIAAFTSGTTYTDKTVPANTEYCYRVGAKNTAGIAYSESPPVACGTAGIVSPAGPTALKMDMSQATISVTWAVPPGIKPAAKDWVALYRTTDPDKTMISGNVCGGKTCWEYTKGAASGTFIVTPPGAGTYDVRYLTNDSFTSAQKSRNSLMVK